MKYVLSIALVLVVAFLIFSGFKNAESPSELSPTVSPEPTPYLEYENPDDIIIPDGKGGVY